MNSIWSCNQWERLQLDLEKIFLELEVFTQKRLLLGLTVNVFVHICMTINIIIFANFIFSMLTKYGIFV